MWTVSSKEPWLWNQGEFDEGGERDAEDREHEDHDQEDGHQPRHDRYHFRGTGVSLERELRIVGKLEVEIEVSGRRDMKKTKCEDRTVRSTTRMRRCQSVGDMLAELDGSGPLVRVGMGTGVGGAELVVDGELDEVGTLKDGTADLALDEELEEEVLGVGLDPEKLSVDEVDNVGMDRSLEDIGKGDGVGSVGGHVSLKGDQLPVDGGAEKPTVASDEHLGRLVREEGAHGGGGGAYHSLVGSRGSERRADSGMGWWASLG